jgi:hypothetical protein
MSDIEATPCESDRDRWLYRNEAAMQLCWTACPRRAWCQREAVKLVDAQCHPVGIFGGFFLPDDQRVSDDPAISDHNLKTVRRRKVIQQLRRLAE